MRERLKLGALMILVTLLGGSGAVAQREEIGPEWVLIDHGESTWYDCTTNPTTCGPPTADGQFLTASGTLYDPEALTMAHPWLPLGTVVKVRSPLGVATLTVNDHGPYCDQQVQALSAGADFETVALIPCELAGDLTRAAARLLIPEWGEYADGRGWGGTQIELYVYRDWLNEARMTNPTLDLITALAAARPDAEAEAIAVARAFSDVVYPVD